jgi:hypothetical protein
MPAGRPRKKLDEKKIEAMARMGCSHEEIALLCDASHDTLTRNYAYIIKRGKAARNYGLRKLQYASARRGNVTMQIWLGKVWLHQKEKWDRDQAGTLDELLLEYRRRNDLLTRQMEQAAAPSPTRSAEQRAAEGGDSSGTD